MKTLSKYVMICVRQMSGLNRLLINDGMGARLVEKLYKRIFLPGNDKNC